MVFFNMLSYGRSTSPGWCRFPIVCVGASSKGPSQSSYGERRRQILSYGTEGCSPAHVHRTYSVHDRMSSAFLFCACLRPSPPAQTYVCRRRRASERRTILPQALGQSSFIITLAERPRVQPVSPDGLPLTPCTPWSGRQSVPYFHAMHGLMVAHPVQFEA